MLLLDDFVSVISVWWSGAADCFELICLGHIFHWGTSIRKHNFLCEVAVHFTDGHSYFNDVIVLAACASGAWTFLVVMLGLWCGAWHCWQFSLSVVCLLHFVVAVYLGWVSSMCGLRGTYCFLQPVYVAWCFMLQLRFQLQRSSCWQVFGSGVTDVILFDLFRYLFASSDFWFGSS